MASIDIDIDDILCGMTDREKQELVDDLYEDGYTAKRDAGEDSIDDEWNWQVDKLYNNRWRLSVEDEATILAITNKIVK